jgi:hypothetical protein
MDRRPDWATIPLPSMTTREETFDMSKVERANLTGVILTPVTAPAPVGTLDDMAGGARRAMPRMHVRPPSARS